MASPITVTITDNSNELDGKAQLRTVRFDGRLDESNVDWQARAVYDLIESTPEGTLFIFDLEGLAFMSSKAVAYLTDWFLKIRAKQGELVLARGRESILELLAVIGLTALVPSCETIAEAMLEIRKRVGAT